MQEFLTGLFGEDVASWLQYVVALLIVIALLLVAAWIFRRLRGIGFRSSAGRGRQPRLQVMDSAPVDGRRRLLLVRRDNVEHLIMIGGPSDIVIEQTIFRGQPPVAQRQPAPGYQQVARAPAPGARPAAPVRGQRPPQQPPLPQGADQMGQPPTPAAGAPVRPTPAAQAATPQRAAPAAPPQAEPQRPIQAAMPQGAHSTSGAQGTQGTPGTQGTKGTQGQNREQQNIKPIATDTAAATVAVASLAESALDGTQATPHAATAPRASQPTAISPRSDKAPSAPRTTQPSTDESVRQQPVSSPTNDTVATEQTSSLTVVKKDAPVIQSAVNADPQSAAKSKDFGASMFERAALSREKNNGAKEAASSSLKTEVSATKADPLVVSPEPPRTAESSDAGRRKPSAPLQRSYTPMLRRSTLTPQAKADQTPEDEATKTDPLDAEKPSDTMTQAAPDVSAPKSSRKPSKQKPVVSLTASGVAAAQSSKGDEPSTPEAPTSEAPVAPAPVSPTPVSGPSPKTGGSSDQPKEAKPSVEQSSVDHNSELIEQLETALENDLAQLLETQTPSEPPAPAVTDKAPQNGSEPALQDQTSDTKSSPKGSQEEAPKPETKENESPKPALSDDPLEQEIGKLLDSLSQKKPT